jgi:hypothetical protein
MGWGIVLGVVEHDCGNERSANGSRNSWMTSVMDHGSDPRML